MKKSAPSALWCSLPLLVVPLLMAGGCRAAWPGMASRAVGNSALVVAPQKSDSVEPAAAVVEQQTPRELKAQGEALVAVLDQLQAIEAIDPQAKAELLNDLKSAQPDNWPLIVKQFQTALAYRQQLLAQEQATEENEEQQLARKHQPARSLAAAPRLPKPKEVLSEAGTVSPTSLAGAVPKQSSAAAAVPGAGDKPRPAATVETPSAGPSAAQEAASASLLESDRPGVPPAQVQQAGYVAPAAVTWQEHLETAITELERTTSPTPDCTAEVQQHLRLRLLRQLAGQAEQALVPTPGASPALQDYWAQQMFALTTFLDHQHLPDTKQRAASSLAYLDKARSKLAELAFLQVRNLTFVDSVDGFGMYQQRTDTKFQPGQQVSLYCEVENFRSDSAPAGYRTVLATSYEVVDLNGQRVDGRDFPEVEDVCRNLRRDFHMQYGVNLPTRIYPGKYELRLVITDQLSHKIGQTSIPLEIVED